jgi:hypothetical protein
VVEVEVLLAGRLRRRQVVVGVGQERCEQHIVDRARRGDLATHVVAHRREPACGHHRVDEPVGRTDVVCRDPRFSARCRFDAGHVRDAAEVERSDDVVGGPGASEGEDVEQGDERRAVALCRNVPRAQVAHDRDAEALGDPRGLTDLHRPERVPALDPVVRRLAVARHRVDATDLVGDCGRHGREVLPHEGVELGELVRGTGPRRQGGDESRAELGRVGRRTATDDPRLEGLAGLASRGEVDDDRVDRVERGARDESEPAHVSSVP